MSVRIGQRVEVPSKETFGTVSFVGTTHFSQGKWVGVILDEPKGKNNGHVQGKSYFQCEQGYGVFLRQTQISSIDNDKDIADSQPSTPAPDTPNDRPKSRLPLGSIHKTPLRTEKEGLGETPQRHDMKKTASFVETGFLETLTPQFTPGLPSPAMQTLEDKANAMQLQQDNTNLKNELIDVQEKLETLKIKRAQDKEKLKEGEKLRLQVEHLIEFKTRIMETQASLQKDLQKSKEETQKAIEERERHIEETQDITDNLEMLTLDREMAEEKAEVLQIELDSTKEKLEELQIDLELLRNESGDMSERGDETVATSAQTRQMKEQNERLRETLVKMRDISAQDKNSLLKLEKARDSDRAEADQISRTTDKQTDKIKDLESTIVDLQEQVDAALGAEEMVETLTERNLDLEEQVADLTETVNDLESMNDMNDLLQEDARELELILREDLDLANGKIRNAVKEQEACGEVIVDQDNTIKKFRDLVSKLQDQNEELRHSLQKETNKPLGTPSEIIDFKKMFSESKAHGKAIELELRRLEVEQANQHVSYLTHYLPDTFMSRGGDHDAVSVLLLLSRAARKADIVIGGLRDRYSSPEVIDRNTILKSHSVDQFSFASKMLHLLYMLQTTLQQYLYVTNSCNVETFLKIAGHYQEMMVYERNLDIYVDLLKKDQLSENTVTEPLEKAVAYFEMLYQSQLSGEKMQQGVYLTDIGRTLGAASDAIQTEASRVSALLHPSELANEMGTWLATLSTTCKDIGECAKRIRRQMPQNGTMGPVSYPNDTQESLSSMLMQMYHAQKAVSLIAKTCMHQTVVIGDPDGGISDEKLKEFVHSATDLIYGSEDQGPESITSALEFTRVHITNITGPLEKGEFDFDGTQQKPAIPPVSLRAEMIKNELKDTEHLKSRLEHRDEDIKDLKVAVKQKNEELSQMTIRRDMADKKLSTASKDADLTIEKLQRKLDDSQALIKRKEKEYEVTTDHLQSDIDNLVVEKGEMRKKLKAVTKENFYQALTSKTSGNTATTPSSPSAASTAQTSSPSGGVSVKDSPLLVQQIADLKSALKHVTDSSHAKIASEMKQKLASLKPLKTMHIELDNKDQRNLLSQRISRLKKDICNMMVGVKVVDISKRHPCDTPPTHTLDPANHLIEHNYKLNSLRKELRILQDQANHLVAAATPAGSVTSALSKFPSTQLVKASSETNTMKIGQITVSGQETCRKVVPLIVDAEQLKNLHLRLLL